MNGGGRSPSRTILRGKFPANWEQYREFRAFNRDGREISPLQRASWQGKLRFRNESEQGSNGKGSGNALP
jgi:hypothetical protein